MSEGKDSAPRWLRRLRSEWRSLVGVRVHHPEVVGFCGRCLRPYPCPTVTARRGAGEADNPWRSWRG